MAKLTTNVFHWQKTLSSKTPLENVILSVLRTWFTKSTLSEKTSNKLTTSYGPSNSAALLVAWERRPLILSKVVIMETVRTSSTTWSNKWINFRWNKIVGPKIFHLLLLSLLSNDHLQNSSLSCYTLNTFTYQPSVYFWNFLSLEIEPTTYSIASIFIAFLYGFDHDSHSEVLEKPV